eukprot:scaffold12956_cov71-Cyclotella_meneghiniana.AAC.11
MPSRKKAQGKARKAKQAAEAEVNPSLDFSNGCHHHGEKNWSREDYDAATSLLDEYVDKCNEIGRVLFARSSDQHPFVEIYRTANVTYNKYHQFTKENDLTKETGVAYSAWSIIMIVTNEMREKYNLAQKIDIGHEVTIPLSDILYCPRQAIKFFHRRNSCDCLQELYYKLKETTKKTSRCNNCSEVVEIRQLSKCEYCNVVQYCSYDCALAHWPTHKVDCERMGYYKPTKPTKSDYLEEVD